MWCGLNSAILSYCNANANARQYKSSTYRTVHYCARARYLAHACTMHRNALNNKISNQICNYKNDDLLLKMWLEMINLIKLVAFVARLKNSLWFFQPGTMRIICFEESWYETITDEESAWKERKDLQYSNFFLLLVMQVLLLPRPIR